MDLTRRQLLALGATVALVGCGRGPVKATPILGTAEEFTANGGPGLMLIPATAVRGVAIWYHGADEDHTRIRDSSRTSALVARLVTDGYVVASHLAGGNGWGNPAAVSDYLATLDMLTTRHPDVPVAHVSFSMGALAGLSVVASGAPCSAWIGLQPVCSLASVLDTEFGASVTAAHGGQPPATSDPVQLDPSRFDGVPMRFYASPDDRLVSKAENADAMAALVAPVAAEADVVECSGDHNDRSHFQPGDVMAFIGRHVA